MSNLVQSSVPSELQERQRQLARRFSVSGLSRESGMRAQPEQRVRLYMYQHPMHGIWQGFLTTDGYFIAAEPHSDDSESIALDGRRAFLASRGTVWDIDSEYETLFQAV